MSEDRTEEILLKTSSQVAHSSVVGLGAAAVASRSGMPTTETDELRRVVDQAMAMLVEAPSYDDDGVIARFFTGGDGFLMEISRSDEAAVSSDAAAQFDEAITGCGIAVVLEPSRSWLRLSKRIRTGL